MLKELVQKIKKKKELSGIDNSIVLAALERCLKKAGLDASMLSGQNEKIIISDTRAELRKISGRFQAFSKEWKNRFELLEQNNIPALLKTHSSTAERIDFYPKLKEFIASLNVNSILDIGCGINPIALASKGTCYYACDINEEELALIGEFFKSRGINGKIFVCDVEKTQISSLPKAELAIIFKVLDIIPNKIKVTESLLSNLGSKYLLFSFSTKTLSGKQMKFPRRFWLERIIKKRNLNYKLFSSPNEIFYFIRL